MYAQVRRYVVEANKSQMYVAKLSLAPMACLKLLIHPA